MPPFSVLVHALTNISIVENFIVIICACMPAVASFAKHRLSGLSTVIPTFGSRMLRSKTGASTTKSGDSSGSSSTMQKQKVDTEGSYYELNDILPLNQSYPAKATLRIDEETGSRRHYGMDR